MKTKNKENKRKVLFIRKDQILADIEAQIEIVSATHLMPDGSPNPVFGNALDRYKVLFDRWIDKYIDGVKSRMAAYVLVPEQRGAMNASRDWEEKELRLSFPWYWNDTTFPNLVTAVHDYIVNSVLMEFFVMTISSRDSITSDKQLLANDAYTEIKHCCVSCLPGTMQKKLKPF